MATVLAAALIAPATAPARLVATKGFHPGAGRIVIARADGTHVHRLADGDEAQIAPNSKLVRVSNRDPGQQGTHPRVMVYRARGGRPLFVIRRQIASLTWSPDSSMLLGVDYTNFNAERLVLIDARTGARTTLRTGNLGYAAFSPDAKQVAFITYGPGENFGGALRVMDLATRAVRTVAQHATQPVWGPGGIAFGTVAHTDYHFANLSLVQPDGSGLRQLTHAAPRQTSGYYPVDWSADSTRLLAGYFDHIRPRVYGIDVINGGAHLIARRVTPDALSNDGRTVIGETGSVCCRDDPINVVGVPWSGGKPHILIRKAFGASSSD